MSKVERKIKCLTCNRMFLTTNGMKEHWRAKHAEKHEPSFASRVIDARIQAAMGNRVDDDLTDWI